MRLELQPSQCNSPHLVCHLHPAAPGAHIIMQLPANLPVDTVLLILYHYVPNKAAAIAAVVLYAIISIAVTAVSIKTRTHYMLTVALTGFLELAGKCCVCSAGHCGSSSTAMK